MPVVARFLLAMSVATVIVAVAVIGLSQAKSPFAAAGAATPDADGGAQVDVTARTDGVVEGLTGATAPFVRVQLPTSVQPGTSRQVRIGIQDRPVRAGMVEGVASSEQMFAIELDIVPADGTHGMAWVSPTRVLVDRRSVPWTRFEVTLRRDVPCGSDLGELRVRVRDLSEGTPPGEALVDLPPVRCIDPPTKAPTSVHDTEPDCGGTIQETGRVPRRSVDGTTMTCRLPHPPRPAVRPAVEQDETDAAVDEDGSDPPEEASEDAGPDPSDTPEGREMADGDELSGDRDDPAPPRDDADTHDREEDPPSTGSPTTTEPFEERAGSD